MSWTFLSVPWITNVAYLGYVYGNGNGIDCAVQRSELAQKSVDRG